MGFFGRLLVFFVVIAALFVIGTTIFSNTASKVAWEFASPISIKDWRFNSEGESFLKLENSVQEELGLKKIEVDGREISLMEALPGNGERIVSFSEVNCVEGEDYSFEVKIYYDSSKGENIVEEGFLPLNGECDGEIQEPSEYFSDLKTAFSTLASSAEEVVETGDWQTVREQIQPEKWNKNFE